jgi:hypothetical protein
VRNPTAADFIERSSNEAEEVKEAQEAKERQARAQKSTGRRKSKGNRTEILVATLLATATAFMNPLHMLSPHYGRRPGRATEARSENITESKELARPRRYMSKEHSQDWLPYYKGLLAFDRDGYGVASA